jgi:16S rRNA (guanine(966)-N(2))-methyltransferase RsmD
MRIIAGTKKGMNLLGPKTMVSRPIIDRVKESLFSVLYKYDLPQGAIVADLFSGVGSLGLEALSRGAEFVTFVDKDLDIVKILKKNIDKAGFGSESKVIRGSAFNIELKIAPEGQMCDLVFVDPPYVKSKNTQHGSPLAGLLESLNEKVKDDGIVVVRTSGEVILLDNYGSLEIIERREWGTMAVAILRSKVS